MPSMDGKNQVVDPATVAPPVAGIVVQNSCKPNAVTMPLSAQGHRQWMLDTGSSVHLLNYPQLTLSETERMVTFGKPTCLPTANGIVKSDAGCKFFTSEIGIADEVHAGHPAPTGSGAISVGRLIRLHGCKFSWEQTSCMFSLASGKPLKAKPLDDVPFVDKQPKAVYIQVDKTMVRDTAAETCDQRLDRLRGPHQSYHKTMEDLLQNITAEQLRVAQLLQESMHTTPDVGVGATLPGQPVETPRDKYVVDVFGGTKTLTANVSVSGCSVHTFDILDDKDQNIVLSPAY